MKRKMKRILVLMGASGSGKTTLENDFTTKIQRFQKVTQVTTREMRRGESQGKPYLFTSHNYFKKIEKNLVGVIKGNSETFKDCYGTFNDLNEEKINTIILSAEGLNDLYNAFNDGRLSEHDTSVFILFVDTSINLILTSPDKYRKGRDKEFLEKEIDGLRKVLEKHEKKINSVSIVNFKNEMRDVKKIYKFLVENEEWFFFNELANDDGLPLQYNIIK